MGQALKTKKQETEVQVIHPVLQYMIHQEKFSTEYVHWEVREDMEQMQPKQILQHQDGVLQGEKHQQQIPVLQ